MPLAARPAQPGPQPLLRARPRRAAARSLERLSTLPDERPRHAGGHGQGLRRAPGDRGAGVHGGLAGEGDPVSLRAPGARLLERPDHPVRAGLRADVPHALVAAQLRRLGRLRGPGLRQRRPSSAVLAEAAVPPRDRSSRGGHGGRSTSAAARAGSWPRCLAAASASTCSIRKLRHARRFDRRLVQASALAPAVPRRCFRVRPELPPAGAPAPRRTGARRAGAGSRARRPAGPRHARLRALAVDPGGCPVRAARPGSRREPRTSRDTRGASSSPSSLAVAAQLETTRSILGAEVIFAFRKGGVPRAGSVTSAGRDAGLLGPPLRPGPNGPQRP